MKTKEEVIKALYNVIDPEIGINIVDLGLVYDIEVNEESINVVMTLTTPGCPMHDTIISWADNILRKYAPGKEIKIDLVWEPVWTPDRISDEAKAQLGYV